MFDKTVELVLAHLHDACGAYALAVGKAPTITREQLEAAVSSNSRGPSPTNMESPVSPVATDEEWLRLQQEVSDLRVQVEAQREHEQSLEEARSKQLRLLPKIPEVEGYEFGCMFRSCDRVGGDFYDFPQISESEWGIAIGDVGKRSTAELLDACILQHAKTWHLVLQNHPQPTSCALPTRAQVCC